MRALFVLVIFLVISNDVLIISHLFLVFASKLLNSPLDTQSRVLARISLLGNRKPQFLSNRIIVAFKPTGEISVFR